MTAAHLDREEPFAKGYVARDYTAQPLGSIPYTTSFDLPLIPEDEWKDRIDAMIADESDLLSVWKRAGCEASNQGPIPYCWAHGGVTAAEALRAREGQPYVNLSATGPGCMIKGFRQRGGNTWDIIPFMAERGIPTVNEWPERDMARHYDNDETWRVAEHYRLTEWYELEPNNFAQKMTCLLNRIPVTVGYSHWGHMVCALRPLYRQQGRNIEWGERGANSWGTTWGPHGDGTYELWGRKAISFDQAAPRVMTVAA